ncbi:MAG: patatin-like phospholipase family protein [Acidobacteriota bacterium]
MDNYRILSLDGGGTWALIEVMALIDLYGGSTTGHQVLSEFDMVAANSGGSIVLGGLVDDMKLDDLLAFFLSQQKRDSVFVEKWIHTSFTPKYSTADKLRGLEAALPNRGGRLMPDAVLDIPGKTSGKPVHLLIIGFDYDRNRARFFRSAPASAANLGDGDPTPVRLVDAIHASSTAPVMYFDKPAVLISDPGKRYWDGGVTGNNNPVLAAVTEAMVLGHVPESVIALALGTGTVVLPPQPPDQPDSVLFAQPYKQWLIGDVQKLAGAIVDDPPDAASFIAHVMTGASPGLPAPVDSRIVRMNPMVSPLGGNGTWSLPDGMNEDTFNALANLGMDAVAKTDVTNIQTLADLWLHDKARNQPIRMNAELAPEVGHAFYSQAKEAWINLSGAD